MRIIIGLGNPGKQYATTRHNAGFLFLEFFRTQWNFPSFEKQGRFNAHASRGIIDDVPIILVQPDTFMNRSGITVSALMNFYKIEATAFAIIHDDIDIPLGKIKYTSNSRSAGHRGVESIIRTLGTTEFFRARIGIYTEPKDNDSPHEASVFVLDHFTRKERSILETSFSEISTTLHAWLKETSPTTKC